MDLYSRGSVEIKGEREIALMREVCRLAAGTLERVGHMLRAGITTQDINDFVHADTLKLGAIQVPINTAYKGEFLRHQLYDSGAKVFIVQGDYASRAAEVRAASAT